MERKQKIRYRKEFAGIAARAAKAGGSDEEIAAILDCHMSTFYRWMKKDDFGKAVTEARVPDEQEEQIALLEWRKAELNEWLNEYLRTRGAKVEVTKAMPDGSVRRITKGSQPSLKLIDRILGATSDTEEFKVTVSVAKPDWLDEDDDDFTREDFDYDPESEED